MKTTIQEMNEYIAFLKGKLSVYEGNDIQHTNTQHSINEAAVGRFYIWKRQTSDWQKQLMEAKKLGVFSEFIKYITETDDKNDKNKKKKSNTLKSDVVADKKII